MRDLNNRGLVYNVLKQRLNFKQLVEHKTQEVKLAAASNTGGLRRSITKAAAVDEREYSSLHVIMAVFHQHFKEVSYIQNAECLIEYDSRSRLNGCF